MLAVGAFPKGHASFSTDISKTHSPAFAKVEFRLPVIDIIGTPNRFMSGNKLSNSCVSPLLEIAITTSFLVIIPLSPWVLSAG